MRCSDRSPLATYSTNRTRRSFSLQGQCGIAPAARAVALNVTVAGPSTTGFLTLFPSDVPQPVSSTISFSAGKTRANNGLLSLSLLGDLTVFNSSASPAQTIVDIAGYFKESTTSRRAFLYSPELSLLAETTSATATPAPLYEYVWLGGKPVAQEKVGDSSALRYTVTDHLGTPLLQTNAAGAIAWRVEHEPFGNVYGYRAGTATDHQPLRFPGQEERSTSPGRSYNIFRWYRPDLGQYSQGDPLGLESGTNLFGYVGGRPIGAADPRGLDAVMSAGASQTFSMTSCAVRVFLEARRRGRQSGVGWGWAHCWASCKLTKECSGPQFAWAFGLGKEVLDFVSCSATAMMGGVTYSGACESAFQPSDFVDNEKGRTCPSNTPCEDRCAPLAGSDSTPGPFFGFGMGWPR